MPTDAGDLSLDVDSLGIRVLLDQMRVGVQEHGERMAKPAGDVQGLATLG